MPLTRRPRQLLLIVLGVIAALALTVWACRTPTQITVEIRTHGFRCDEIKRLTIAVAKNPAIAEERMTSGFVAAEVVQDKAAPAKDCLAEDRVGTLVVTPDDATGAIIVAASYDTSERCVPPDYKGCIVARRAFTFVERSSLLLPVTLELRCKDVPCGVFTSCRAGECVSSNATCEEGSGTCTSEAEPVFTADGGSIPSEASVQPDGAPLDDGGVLPDGGPADGGESEAGVDAGIDSGPGATNFCRADAGYVDCYKPTDATSVCCQVLSSYACGVSPCPNGVYYPCLGRKHCQANQYCCALAPGSGPQSQCMNACSAFVFCNVSLDCPPGTYCDLDAGGPAGICQ